MKKNILKILSTEISFMLSISLVAFVIYLLSFIKDELNYTYILNTYIFDISNFVAEKHEFLQYIFSFIIFVISFIIFKSIMNKLLLKLKDKVIKILYYTINTIFVIGALVLFYAMFAHDNNIYFYYYVYSREHSFYYWLISIYLILVIYLIYKFCKYFSKKSLTIFNTVIYVIIIILLTIFSSTIITKSFAFCPLVLYHTNAYIYPIIKIYNGIYPLVDFNSLYGFYSYVYAFILKILGSSSTYNISILLSITTFITFLNIMIFSSKLIKNKIIIFLELASLICFNFIATMIKNAGIYPQFLPGRMICPSLILVYSLIFIKYRKTNKRNIIIIIGYLLSSFSLFFNIETGIVVLGTFMSLLGYEALCKYKFNDIKLYKEILKIILCALLSFLLFLFSVMLISFIVSGKLVNIKNILYGVSIFLGSGFFMIKMELLNPWIIIGLIYFTLIAISLSKIKVLDNESKEFDRNALIFILGILGILVFSYYEGRSHDAVLLDVSYPAFIGLGIILDLALKKLVEKVGVYNKIILSIVSIAILLLFSLFTLSAFDLSYNNYYANNYYNFEYKNSISRIETMEEQIDKYKSDLPELEFLIRYETYWYERYNMIDTKKMNDNVDMFTYKDLYKVITYLKEEKKDLIVTYNIFEYSLYKYKNNIKELMDSGYKIYYDNECNHVIFVYSSDEMIKTNDELIRYNYGDIITKEDKE